MFTNRFQFWWVAISLWLATLLSRVSITSLNTILNPVSLEFNLTNAQQGLIISLPTLVMAIVSAFIARLDRRFGVVITILLGVILIGAGFIVRNVFSMFPYFQLLAICTGIVISSMGLTIVSTLYPTFINAFFKKQIDIMSSINSTNLSFSALLGTISATYMVSAGYTWREVGVLWIIICFGIALFYVPTIYFTRERIKSLMIAQEKREHEAKQNNNTINMYKSVTAWCIAIGFGLQSTSFYFSLGWYPVISQSYLTESQLSFLLSAFQLLSFPFSLFAPYILVRYPQYTIKFMMTICTIFTVTTIGMLYITNYYLIFADFLIFGVSSALLVSAYMTLIALKTVNPLYTSKLASMMSCIAYFITSILLYSFGALKGLTGSLETTFLLVIIYSVFVPVFAYLTCKLPIKGIDLEKEHLNALAHENHQN